MKTQLRFAVACTVVTALYSLPVPAAEASPKPPLADRKAACTEQARGLKAAERDDFVSWCLTQDVAVAKQARAPVAGSQQDKMRKCNVVAKERTLKGDERRAFMSSCLKS